MTREEFSTIAASIPSRAGCYRYYDDKQKLLYVGKAKNLRKRVSSYFYKTGANYKTLRLVALIKNIEVTVTDNEHDAFLLENSLIKHHQPRFNISLRDDKTYPSIVIKNENFPRVFFTRKIIRDGSEYLGPFTGVWRAKELLQLIKNNIPLRTCNLPLTPSNIKKGKFKVCLEYHLGNCKGPCEGLQSENDYRQSIQQVRHVLKGNTNEVIKSLREEMQSRAESLEFEKAAALKNKIDALLQYTSKSSVVSTHVEDVDIATIISDEDNAFVNYMMLSTGSVIYSKSIAIEKLLDEEDQNILSLAVSRLRDASGSTAQEIVVPFEIDVTDEMIKLTIPKAGDKKNYWT